MSTPAIDESPSNEPLPFRGSHWSTSALVIGCLVVMAMRGLTVAQGHFAEALPYWGWVVLGALVPHLFLLGYPLLTRSPRRRLSVPGLRELAVESGFALLTLFSAILMLGLANALVESARPGTGMKGSGLEEVAYSSHTSIATALLLSAFLIAPLTEEIFFRGFLYNALRARMPFLLAAVVQSVIFGAGHTFGTAHAIAAGGLGFLFALLYEWRKTLVTPILAHGGMNLLASIAAFGLMSRAGDLPQLGINGPAEPRGCVVEVITPGSAADQSKLELGDVIAAIDGQPAPDYQALRTAVRSHKPGDEVTLTVYRRKDTLLLKVVLQRRGP